MNSRKISFFFATIAALTGGVTLPADAAPSPSKGVICPAGFTGESVDGGFRCKKVVNVLIDNICTNAQLPKLNLRNGRDVCTNQNTTVSVNDALTGLNAGRDFVFSVADPAAKQKAEARLEAGFASGTLQLPVLAKKRPVVALPIIPKAQREAVFVSQKVLVDDAGDIDDHTRVTFNVFVFPTQKP